ncbi:hypothetical protein ACWHAM_26750 [Paenibacillus terrae]
MARSVPSFIPTPWAHTASGCRRRRPGASRDGTRPRRSRAVCGWAATDWGAARSGAYEGSVAARARGPGTGDRP